MKNRLVYADSSALVKFVIDEPWADALRRHLADPSRLVVTSAIARVEVHRAAAIAHPGASTTETVERALASWRLVAVTDAILEEAVLLATRRLRSLDAIHLASALFVRAAELVTYDDRLVEAARARAMTVVQPGVGSTRGRRLHDRDA